MSMYCETNFDIPLYKGKLIIILCDDSKLVKDLCPDFQAKELFAHAYNGDYKGYDGFFVILNPFLENYKITNGVVAHEALHIVNMLFMNRKVEYQLDNDEHTCYLLEWVVNRVNEYLLRNNFILNTF